MLPRLRAIINGTVSLCGKVFFYFINTIFMFVDCSFSTSSFIETILLQSDCDALGQQQQQESTADITAIIPHFTGVQFIEITSKQIIAAAGS